MDMYVLWWHFVFQVTRIIIDILEIYFFFIYVDEIEVFTKSVYNNLIITTLFY